MAGGSARASVLVVDDTLENLQLLSSMLEGHGYEARPVTSGSRALQAALSYPPDLVLLDVTMPDMDGYEVCRRLKASEPLREIPVIFITALASTEDKVKAFEMGGADYVTKPFQLDEVLARVRVHVGLRQSRGQLVESYRRLQALERLREDLVRMVVHDMRSPLMVLMGLLDLVQDKLVGAQAERVSEDLGSAVHAAASINRMANALLDVSRLEERKLPLDWRPHDLVSICRDVIRQLSQLDRTRVIELSGVRELAVACDGDVVGRVVENLLSNAVKHTPCGSSICVSAASDGHWARVSVQDHGPGVPQGARLKIFEKFASVAARTAGRFHSAGLGLAFCKLAVEAHGGNIGVDDVQPNGCSFWFTLPLS